jgi:acetolactate synthase-1/2/3 large subunit
MLLTGGEIIADYLIRENVPYVAGIPGHGIMPVFDALYDRRERIRLVQVRHEQAAVHLADGYFRVAGHPLAVLTSIGPGAVNTAVGAACAYLDSVPVLIITGSVHTHMLGRGILQEIERQHWSDFPNVLRPVVKRYWQVPRVDLLPRVLHQAFNCMLSGRPGPVLIDVPMDVQADSIDVILPEPTAHRAGAGPGGDPQAVERAAALLERAKRPVILAGGGVLLSQAWNELRALAELLDAAVVTTQTGKSAMPEDHPLYGWHTGAAGTAVGAKLTTSADVILAVGCRFDDETSCSFIPGRAFSIPPTKLVHVDIDPFEIGKNYPVAVGVVGDARLVLSSLHERLQERASVKRKPGYVIEIDHLRRQWLDQVATHQASDLVPVTIPRFFKELQSFLNEDAILVTSAGTPQAHMMQCFTFKAPRTNVTSGGFSTMGFGLPAGIGAKLAAPKRQVVVAVGDGDFMMTMQELDTAAQYDVGLVIVVLNNGYWASIRDLQVDRYGEDRVFGVQLRGGNSDDAGPNFARIAQDFGAWSERVSRAEEIQPALARAFASGRPALLEVMVHPDFRPETTLLENNAWWDVPVPSYLAAKRDEYMRDRLSENLL